MAGFEFREHKIKLLLAGEKFEIEAENYEKRAEFAKRAQELGGKMAELEAAEVDTALKLKEDLLAEIVKMVDDFLDEDGACKRIFKDRPVSFADLTDLCYYIADETNKQSAAFSRLATNRAQRRKNKKK